MLSRFRLFYFFIRQGVKGDAEGKGQGARGWLLPTAWEKAGLRYRMRDDEGKGVVVAKGRALISGVRSCHLRGHISGVRS